MERTGAVILAAGLSSRMHEFKPLLELGDSTIIVRAIENLKTAGASPVIIVAGYKADQLMDYLWPLDITFSFFCRYKVLPYLLWRLPEAESASRYSCCHLFLVHLIPLSLHGTVVYPVFSVFLELPVSHLSD